MKLKQFIDSLSVETKFIVATVFLALIIAAGAYVAVQNSKQSDRDDKIEQAKIMLEIKTGEINSLRAVVANRDSAAKVLVSENRKKDELLRASEANKKAVAEKYRQELARQQTLSDTAAYRLFLSNMGCSTFKGGRYDSAYLAPIEAIWNANGVVAENNMLASLNKILTYDAAVYKMKIKTLDDIVATGDKNMADLKTALQISESKKEEFGQQIDATDQKIKSERRKTVVTYIVGCIAIIGALIL